MLDEMLDYSVNADVSTDSGRRALGSIYSMMTSSKGNIFRVTGPLCVEFTGPGEFPAQRPVTWSFDVFFDLCLNHDTFSGQWCKSERTVLSSVDCIMTGK